jgi:uncharacterized FlaG/YvyC family protein
MKFIQKHWIVFTLLFIDLLAIGFSQVISDSDSSLQVESIMLFVCMLIAIVASVILDLVFSGKPNFVFFFTISNTLISILVTGLLIIQIKNWISPNYVIDEGREKMVYSAFKSQEQRACKLVIDSLNKFYDNKNVSINFSSINNLSENKQDTELFQIAILFTHTLGFNANEQKALVSNVNLINKTFTFKIDDYETLSEYGKVKVTSNNKVIDEIDERTLKLMDSITNTLKDTPQ